jgi:Arylsulfotransferase (ASST)
MLRSALAAFRATDDADSIPDRRACKAQLRLHTPVQSRGMQGRSGEARGEGENVGIETARDRVNGRRRYAPALAASSKRAPRPPSPSRPASAIVALSVFASLLLAAGAGTAGAAEAGAPTFYSEPALAPPTIEMLVPPSETAGASSEGAATPSYLLLAPIRAFSRDASFVGKPGPELLQGSGELVWQRPLGSTVKVDGKPRKLVAMDLHTATYEGKRVLVWWQGHITPQGFGNGAWQIVNQHYKRVATVRAPTGYETDFHDIDITENGMAYVLGGKVAKLSLGCCGGPAKGELYDQVLFEVNTRTHQVVWKWDPLQHVPLRESYARLRPHQPWDPYHVNSISLGPSGNVILSARNTWAVYWINRARKRSGVVLATLGGKDSTFKLGDGVRFAWQHDVSGLPGGELSIFDDEAAPVEGKQSRGLLLRLDFASHVATKVHEYLLAKPALAGSQGSTEVEEDGNVFVGWGQLPYFSEYSNSGKLLFEGSFTGADESYRAYRSPWIGLPATKPALAVRTSVGGDEAYASWNGATQVVSWQLLAGSSPGSLRAAGEPVARSGFQTAIATSSAGPYYAVQAIDRAGKVLGTSSAVQVAASEVAASG